MSESVEILISADDQASKKFIDAAANIEKSSKRVESILNSLKSPADKYSEQLEELARLQKEGAISADQLAAAQAKITEKIKGNGNAFKEMGGKAKATTEFVGTLAALTGNSELASFAGQMAGVTEKVGAFSDVAKSGGAGALAFKLGLVGLVGTLALGIGKAIGDVIFQTAKLERELNAAKERSNELNDAMATMQAQEFSNRKEDIELIRDPAEKQAAQKQMLDELNRNIMAVTGNVNKGKREVEEWADAWQITGDRKLSAEMAAADLANDQERLKVLKAQRDEMIQLTSVRAQENELIRQANAAKDKSESYIETLKLEVEYLAATREEQIKLDAARNTTVEDRGEAEKLLAERDALLAKADAAKELEQVQQQARDAEARAAEQAKQKADAELARIENIKTAEEQRLELQRIEIEQGKEAAKVKALMNQGLDEKTATKLVEDGSALDKAQSDKDTKAQSEKDDAAELKRIEEIKRSEEQRLELQRIEIEQGKEAAKVKALMNQGVDEASAKKIAAEEAAIEELKKNAKGEEKPGTVTPAIPEAAAINASQGRLTTRGPGEKTNELLREANTSLAKLSNLDEINKNLKNRPPVVNFVGVL